MCAAAAVAGIPHHMVVAYEVWVPAVAQTQPEQ